MRIVQDYGDKLVELEKPSLSLGVEVRIELIATSIANGEVLSERYTLLKIEPEDLPGELHYNVRLRLGVEGETGNSE